METPKRKALTYRVQGIPKGTTRAQLIKNFFYAQDQDDLTVKSLCPSVESVVGEEEKELTATLLFRPREHRPNGPRVQDMEIEVDSDFTGFTPLCVPPGERGSNDSIKADIIAVTGLAGHAFGSWAHRDDKMWLRDYLKYQAPNARILTYGYSSELQNGSLSILYDYTISFVNALVSMRDAGQCEQRPIIFIGHSLGCLLIKKALIETTSIGIGGSRLPVRCIVFIAAPHRGLDVTALQTLVKDKPPETMVSELKPGSPTLQDLNSRFKLIAQDIDILTLHETKKTRTVKQMEDGSWKRIGDPVMMVDKDSATGYYFKEKAFHAIADHSEIAKLKKGSESFTHISYAIRCALRSTADIAAENYQSTSGEFVYQQAPQWISPPVSSYHRGAPFYSNAAASQSNWGLLPVWQTAIPERISTPSQRTSELLPRQPHAVLSRVPTPAPDHVSTRVADCGRVRMAEDYLGPDKESINYGISQEELLSLDVPDVQDPVHSKTAPLQNAAGLLPLQQDTLPVDTPIAAQEHIAPPGLDLVPPPKIGKEDPVVSSIVISEETEDVCDQVSQSEPSQQETLISSADEHESGLTSSIAKVESCKPVPPDHGASFESTSSRETAIETVQNLDGAKDVLAKTDQEAVSQNNIFACCNVCGQHIPDSERHYACLECFSAGNKEWCCSSCLEEFSNSSSSTCKMSCFAVIVCPGFRYRVAYSQIQVSDDDSSIIRAIKSDDVEALHIAIRNEGLPVANDGVKSMPLHLAIMLGRTECARVLLRAGAPNLKESRDEQDRTPLMWAASHHNLEMVRILLEYFVDIDSVSRGHTALSYAVLLQQPDMVSFLLENNAKIEVKGTPTLPVEAALKGDEKTLNLLLGAGADVNSRGESSGSSALFQAAKKGHEKVVKMLLSCHADVEVADKDGLTPVSAACHYGRTSIAQLLLSAGADINVANSLGETPLHHAAAKDHLETVNLLLERGAEIDARTANGRTPLLVAASNGQDQICQRLLDAGADLEAKSPAKETALILACWKSQVGAVKTILSHCPDINSQDHEGYTGLHWAAEKGNLEICEALVKHGANLDTKTKEDQEVNAGMTALHLATKYGNGHVVEFLLSQHAKVDAADFENYTSLHWAAEKGNLGICEALVNHRADLNPKTKPTLGVNAGTTPLHLATKYDNGDVVKFLLSHDAEVDARDCEDFSSLHWAAKKGYLEICKSLVSHQAGLDLTTKTTIKADSGMTPLILATRYNHGGVVDLLLSSDAKVDIADWEDYTSLHWAAEAGRLQICKSLLIHKASLIARTCYSKTALFLAVQNEHSAVVELLLQNGSDPNGRCDGMIPLYKAAILGNMDSLRSLVKYGANLNLENNNGYNAVSGAACEGIIDVVEFLLGEGASGAPPSALGGKWKNQSFQKHVMPWTKRQVLRLVREAKRR